MKKLIMKSVFCAWLSLGLSLGYVGRAAAEDADSDLAPIAPAPQKSKVGRNPSSKVRPSAAVPKISEKTKPTKNAARKPAATPPARKSAKEKLNRKPNLTPSVVQAAPPPSREEVQPTPLTVFKKSESHKFSGLRLKGQLKKPDLTFIYKRKGLRQEQIVDIPETFNNEVLEGASQF